MSEPTNESGETPTSAPTTPTPVVPAQPTPAAAEPTPVAAPPAVPAPTPTPEPPTAATPVSPAPVAEPVTAPTPVPAPAAPAAATPAPEATAPLATAPPAKVTTATQPVTIVKKSKAGAVWAFFAVLFLIAAGAAGYLYYNTKQTSDKKIADQTAQISQLNDTIKSKDSALTKAQQDAKTAQDAADAANKKFNDNAACTKAAQDFVAAGLAGDDAATTTSLTQIFSRCRAGATP